MADNVLCRDLGVETVTKKAHVLYRKKDPNLDVCNKKSAKLTDQRGSYAFTCSPFSIHVRHFAYFQHRHSCIGLLLIFYRYQ